MDEQDGSTRDNQANVPHKLADKSQLPIRQDSAIDVSGSPGNQEIESVKAIYRPPEVISQPIKSYWKWIWIVVVAAVILAGAYLAWYFTKHHAPYSAASLVVPAIHRL